MKKKRILGLVLAFTFMFSLTSCRVSELFQVEEHQVAVKNNELSKTAYKEYSNTFTDLTYEEFLNKVVLTNKSHAVFASYYVENKFVLTFYEGKFYEKVESFTDSNSIISNKYSYYNNDWRLSSVEKKTDKLILSTYYKYNDDNSYSSKTEYITNLENNNEEKLTYTYLNNEFVCIKKESEHSNGWLTDFYFTFNSDGILKEKKEFKYNDDGVIIEKSTNKYIDNEWIMTSKEDYINGQFLETIHAYTDSDGSVSSRREYKYDELGNQTEYIEYKRINKSWVPSYGAICIRGISLVSFDLEFDCNDSIIGKIEYNYDDLKRINKITYVYKDGEFLFDTKEEYKYDKSGNRTVTSYSFIDGQWVLQS